MISLIKDQTLGNFIKHIMYTPFSWLGQRCYGPREDGFLEDFFTIELAKYFYIGEEAYRLDPQPRRLICTESFSKEKMIEEAKRKEKDILEFIDSCIGEDYDTLSIINVGRGLDIVLIQSMMHVSRIICYDEDSLYGPFLLHFFNTVEFEKYDPSNEIGANSHVFESRKLCK